ncbi:MAG: hypothetical protein P8Y60_06920 [Calditrichota bacterium]
MEKLTHIITRILATVLIILMAAMVLDVTWQVFTRFILKNPSSLPKSWPDSFWSGLDYLEPAMRFIPKLTWALILLLQR